MVIAGTEIKKQYIAIASGVVASIILLFIAIWVINSSFIEIRTTNGEGGEFSYSFLNQADNKTTEVKSVESVVKQLVSNGNYEVLVRQNYTSSFSIIKTQAFLHNSFLEVVLQPENSRQYVGNNPQDCMSYINNQLISFACNGYLADALVHMPATSSLPTFTTTTRGQGPAGYNEGIFTTTEGNFALSQFPVESESGPQQVLYRLGSNFNAAEVVFMPGLSNDIRYTAKPYKTGFIIYTPDYNQILYFPSYKSQPTNITTYKTNPIATTPISLDILGESILTAYINAPSTENDRGVKTKVVVSSGGTNQEYVFNKQYSQASFCGEKRLCLLANKTMEVFSIENQTAVYTYSIHNVEAMLNTPHGFLVANTVGVMNFNTTNQNGYMSYSFGEYRFGGMVAAPNGYIVRVIGAGERAFALAVDLTKPNTTNIDKKILELQKVSNVSSVSVYGPYIFVTANIPAIYSQAASGYIPDPEKSKTINTAINQAVNNLGLTQAGFQIINTSQ